MNEKSSVGGQTINCKVASCRYHNASMCELSRIEVEPRPGCSSQDREESLCGSYRSKESGF